jgi:hypothetical protein
MYNIIYYRGAGLRSSSLAYCYLRAASVSGHASVATVTPSALPFSSRKHSGPPYYISGLDGVSTPQLFYTYFYNHAHRLRLEKLL